MRRHNPIDAMEWLGESTLRQIGRGHAAEADDISKGEEFVQSLLDAGALKVDVVGAYEYPNCQSGYGKADCIYITLPADPKNIDAVVDTMALIGSLKGVVIERVPHFDTHFTRSYIDLPRSEDSDDIENIRMVAVTFV